MKPKARKRKTAVAAVVEDTDQHMQEEIVQDPAKKRPRAVLGKKRKKSTKCTSTSNDSKNKVPDDIEVILDDALAQLTAELVARNSLTPFIAKEINSGSPVKLSEILQSNSQQLSNISPQELSYSIKPFQELTHFKPVETSPTLDKCNSWFTEDVVSRTIGVSLQMNQADDNKQVSINAVIPQEGRISAAGTVVETGFRKNMCQFSDASVVQNTNENIVESRNDFLDMSSHLTRDITEIIECSIDDCIKQCTSRCRIIETKLNDIAEEIEKDVDDKHMILNETGGDNSSCIDEYDKQLLKANETVEADDSIQITMESERCKSTIVLEEKCNNDTKDVAKDTTTKSLNDDNDKLLFHSNITVALQDINASKSCDIDAHILGSVEHSLCGGECPVGHVKSNHTLEGLVNVDSSIIVEGLIDQVESVNRLESLEDNVKPSIGMNDTLDLGECSTGKDDVESNSTNKEYSMNNVALNNGEGREILLNNDSGRGMKCEQSEHVTETFLEDSTLTKDMLQEHHAMDDLAQEPLRAVPTLEENGNITDSQLNGLEWCSQFISDETVMPGQSSMLLMTTEIPKIQCAVISVHDNGAECGSDEAFYHSMCTEDGSAIINGLIKDVALLNKMIQKTMHDIDVANRQRHN